MEVGSTQRLGGATYSDLLAQLGPEQFRRSALLAEVGQGPIPAVLDTSYVRTGIHTQLRTGNPPKSIIAAQQGRTRVFMEEETLNESWQRLERFADQLDVSVRQLRAMFADDWLPNISVVSLPENARSIDERALAVKSLDPNDYPTAALAALLSPCILLTGDHHHFAPLGVSYSRQGVDAIFAAIEVRIGENQLQSVAMVPAAPVYTIGVGTKWAYEKIGPLALILLAGIVVGAVVLYRCQPEERRHAVREVASGVGNVLLGQYNQAQRAVTEAQTQLSICLVPPPDKRSVPSAVLRKLATAGDSMSAQQLYEQLPAEVQPALVPLRQWMHANKPLFSELRRGSFRLGNRYSISVAT
jgi:PIN domain